MENNKINDAEREARHEQAKLYMREYMREWRRANPEKQRALNDKYKEYRRQWAIDHPEKVKEIKKRYYERHSKTMVNDNDKISDRELLACIGRGHENATSIAALSKQFNIERSELETLLARMAPRNRVLIAVDEKDRVYICNNVNEIIEHYRTVSGKIEYR